MFRPIATGNSLPATGTGARALTHPDNEQRRTRGLRQEVASSIAWSVMHWE